MSIQLKHLVKKYEGSDTPVLENVSAHIEDNEFFAIVGPSGCGKSTLLRMIAGIIPITSGKLYLNENVANDLAPQERKLSMVFQSYALYPFLSVFDNVAFGLKARKQPKEMIKERVTRALALVNLTDYKDRKPKDLSGGQRQRVALARAIANESKICLMDEPLSNLDAQLRAKMRIELKELQRKLGLTVIYVTHDQVEAMTMADHVMVLNNHHVQQIDTPLGVYQHPRNEFVASFFGTPQINLISAVFENGRLKVNDDFIMETDSSLIDGHNYKIGVRPNQVQIKSDVNNGNAQVVNVSQLGDRTMVEAILNNQQEIRVVLNGQVDIRPQQFIQIEGADEYFIFDSDDRSLVSVNKGALVNA
ncbi:ABC transporter ATP-binding protein (plasmid) [Nicoliella spurrieriana]|uniref:ABC transporter ATP-binding protein n=1 Tax=Nicoliella spurrieriana TaxID=2925830 RepID=A0A976RQQ0_9LACO|nr:ABC transporter ATP-binding protein [Nicoliella spurrieriana]UQS86081.1 ABC transporter ATP-binding protein [Nicoliella spurrieriana]